MIATHYARARAHAGGLLLAILLIMSWITPLQAAQVLDGVAAVVDDSVILKSELNAEMQRVTAMLRAQNRLPPPRDVLRKQVLEHLIMMRIQLLEAHRRGLHVSDQ